MGRVYGFAHIEASLLDGTSGGTNMPPNGHLPSRTATTVRNSRQASAPARYWLNRFGLSGRERQLAQKGIPQVRRRPSAKRGSFLAMQGHAKLECLAIRRIAGP